MQELLEADVKITKTYKVMSESELKREATKLSKDDNKYIADVGIAILNVLVKGAVAVTDLLSAVNVLIFTAPAMLAHVLTIVISTILFIVLSVPPGILDKALKAQKHFLKSVLKNINEPTKQYFNAIDDITNGRYISTVESSNEFSFSSITESIANWDMLLEAPKEDEPTDYTKEVDNPNDEKDEPKDYTEDVTTNDEPETQDETEDEPTDYTEEVEPDKNTDNIEDNNEPEETQDETDDEPTDDTEGDTVDDTTADNTNDENTIVKNYNLLVDFQNMHKTIGEILDGLHDVVYPQPIQNQVLTKGINNLQEIREQIEKYINYSFSDDYKKNTYYYTVYLQACKMNLEMLRKNYQLDKE